MFQFFTLHYMQYLYIPSTGCSLKYHVVLVLQTHFSSVFGNRIEQVRGCDNMNNEFWRYKRAHWTNVHIFFLCIYIPYATYFRLSKYYNRSCWMTYPIKKKKKRYSFMEYYSLIVSTHFLNYIWSALWILALNFLTFARWIIRSKIPYCNYVVLKWSVMPWQNLFMT